jgi:hypothetical protein
MVVAEYSGLGVCARARQPVISGEPAMLAPPQPNLDLSMFRATIDRVEDPRADLVGEVGREGARS